LERGKRPGFASDYRQFAAALHPQIMTGSGTILSALSQPTLLMGVAAATAWFEEES
jgi:hypothetical protein